ncbi:MAG: START domain-containing protein [Saprospiraceae bacterium]
MRYLFLLLLIASSFTSFAQSEAKWELKSQKEGISVYSRELPNSNLKELKMTSTAQSSTQAFIKILEVIQTNPDWLDAEFEVKRIKVNEEGIPINHSKIDFPFPVSDRDLVSSAQVIEDKETGVVTVKSEAVAGILKEKSGYVRMSRFLSRWILTPQGDGMLNIEYFLQSDPGGAIPTWVVNMLSSVGPFKTFKAIKENLANYQ